MEGTVTGLRAVLTGVALLAAAVAGCREIVEFDPAAPPGSASSIVWERTAGPQGEAILSLRVDAAGVLYAGTESGRLYRSVTDGAEWTPIPLPAAGGAVAAIVVDPLRRIFVANDVRGVFQSDDGGANWTAINDGLSDTAITALAYLPTGDLAAGSAGGVFSITGPGAPRWRERAVLARAVTAILALSSEELLIGTWNAGIFRHRRSDSSTTPVSAGLPDLFVHAIHPGTGGFVFAGTRNGGAFRTDPETIFWQNAGGGSIPREVTSFRTTQFGELFAGTSAGVFVSLDAGLRWSALETGLGPREVRALSVNADARVFAGTADGVYRSVRLTPPSAGR